MHKSAVEGCFLRSAHIFIIVQTYQQTGIILKDRSCTHLKESTMQNSQQFNIKISLDNDHVTPDAIRSIVIDDLDEQHICVCASEKGP